MLTKKQRELLILIHEHIQQDGIAPSFEEMKETLGLKSKSGIHRLISALVERGYLERLPHRARALEVKKLPENYSGPMPNQNNVSESPFYNADDHRHVTPIPMHGKIAAGTPIEAIRSEGHTIDMPAFMLGRGDYYALTIEGDSMIGAGIHDEDVVIVERCDNARDGEIVVALVDDQEATLKRLRRLNDGRLALEAENAAYEPRVLDAARVQIQGRLASLYRQY